MFEFIRTRQRLMQLLLLLLILPSFAFFGLQSYSRFQEGDNTIAKVGKQKITQQEWDAAKREQMERFRRMFGQQFDPKMVDTPQARQGILDNLVAQHVMSAEAARLKLVVPDSVLQQAILQIPGLTGADGKFDVVRYKEVLGAQGLTPAIYQEQLRHDLALQQLNGAIQSTAFAPKTVAKMLSDLNAQQRSVRAMVFKSADYAAKVKVTDEAMKNYYSRHGAEFTVPEQVDAQFVVLDLDAVADKMSVNDADIKSYYEQNIKRYTVDEQRRASHILIAVDKNASDADKAKAKAKAEALLAQVRANPSSFAEIAKKNSQDPGSAPEGGDLGFFGKNAMVKPFEDAVYKLKEGEISDVVQSDFGYHIIRLTGIKPPAVKPLADVKDEIAADIRKQMASKKFSELAETFNNTVYEQADSLKAAADKLGLKIQSANGIGRQPNPDAAPNAPYNSPKFLNALFSDDVIKNKHNTEAIEVTPNVLVAGRVVNYRPAAKKPFEDVKDTIRKDVVAAEAADLAKKAGEAKLAELRKHDDAAGFGPEKEISRAANDALPGEAADAVLAADVSSLPAYAGTVLPDGYGIYRIGKVSLPEKPDQARREAEAKQITSTLAQEETVAYIHALRDKIGVKIVKPVATASDDAAGK